MSSVQILSNLNYPIGKVINMELQNSMNTKIAVAFLKYSGVKEIENSLLKSIDNGGKFEMIVGLDFRTTDPKSLMFFIKLKTTYPNVKFYCFGDKKKNKTDIVFHPKIYLFENKKEFISIVGSTNLTGGGLNTNFEVNTIFTEKNPIYFSQLKAIYNSIKFTDSVFIPDEDYLKGYSDIFSVFEKNNKKAIKDKGVSKVIKEIEEKAKLLPGTVPSIKSMIVDFIKSKNKEGYEQVSLSEIYNALEKRIQNEKIGSNYKLDTFRNSIRGELNHHEENSNSKNSMKLFKRVDKGLYSLTQNGKNYKGR